TTVMGDKAISVTDIQTDGWYDYSAKYEAGGSRHVIPADIPADIFDACLDYAERAHQVLGCRGVSRTDYRWDESKGLAGLILLETNTQPGMTPTSLAPEQAAAGGVPFGKLVRWMVEDASCNR
ncbi:MAG: D-alanine--D-alanine ligase, partial [Proteobacteria bacterium]|nr:D-alanine--D-alanine ligase [Pseudomonadota bacterium]